MDLSLSGLVLRWLGDCGKHGFLIIVYARLEVHFRKLFIPRGWGLSCSLTVIMLSNHIQVFSISSTLPVPVVGTANINIHTENLDVTATLKI